MGISISGGPPLHLKGCEMIMAQHDPDRETSSTHRWPSLSRNRTPVPDLDGFENIVRQDLYCGHRIVTPAALCNLVLPHLTLLLDQCPAFTPC